MIRLLWLQSRKQIVGLAGIVAVAAVVLFITGKDLAEIYDTTVANCEARGNCETARVAMLDHYSGLRTALGIFVIALPGLIGAFWGAPLVAREFESGTFRLVWTQGVTRTRWMLVKLLGGGLAAVVVTGLVTLMVTLWAHPVDRSVMDQYATFDQRDIVPIGHAAFAFALGVTAGLFTRRTVPAMLIVLVLFTAVRLFEVSVVREDLAPTTQAVGSIERSALHGLGVDESGLFMPALPEVDIPNGWVLSTRFIEMNGHVSSDVELDQFIKTECPAIPLPKDEPNRNARPSTAEIEAFGKCMDKVAETYKTKVTYQAATNYWKIQWIETAIYGGLALLLSSLSVLWVRRRHL